MFVLIIEHMFAFVKRESAGGIRELRTQKHTRVKCADVSGLSFQRSGTYPAWRTASWPASLTSQFAKASVFSSPLR